MINNWSELKKCIQADKKALGMTHPFLASLTYGEHARVLKYIISYRYTAYFKAKKSIFGKLIYAVLLLRHRRLSLRSGMSISPNSEIGKGLNLPHTGPIYMGGIKKMGDYCTVLPMTLFGKQTPGIKDINIVIGDNCYFGVGCKVLGPVTIGNNVTVCAGAIVTKDLPDNTIVTCAPPKILKFKKPMWNFSKSKD